MKLSRDTKNLNLDKDFDDIMSKIKQIGWNESNITTDSEDRRKMQISSRWSHMLKGRVESMMTLVAERSSLEEMKTLRRVCMLSSVWAKEWQYKELLSDLDDQVWRELTDDWQKFVCEKEESPAL